MNPDERIGPSTNEVIIIEKIAKQYRLGQIGTGTLSHDINRWWHQIRGKADPYAKIGEENDRTKKGISAYVWALSDISFQVKQGEVVGIIGKNGAGKSTLLKILSRVTSPSSGIIKAKGRIASLLEVGTGFHPEMTGKENIYMNGTIMGMTRREIDSKLEEIVSFAGVERYLDTPVKRYSSGMKVRLGFAVAAHLDPEILVIDEVLAVGDAEFQKKAIGKIQDISTEMGRTILFVSHNMASVRNLCDRVILLENGKVAYDGEVEGGIDLYLHSSNIQETFEKTWSMTNTGENEVFVKKIFIHDYNGIFIENTSEIKIGFHLSILRQCYKLFLGIKIEDSQGNILIMSSSDECEMNVIEELGIGQNHEIIVKVPGKIIKPGKYYIGFVLRESVSNTIYHKEERVISFNADDTITYKGVNKRYRSKAMISPEVKFEIHHG